MVCDGEAGTGKKVPAPGAADFISRPAGTTYASRQGAASGCSQRAAMATNVRRIHAWPKL